MLPTCAIDFETLCFYSYDEIQVPFGNSGLNTQQTYSTLNAMMLENPAPLRC